MTTESDAPTEGIVVYRCKDCGKQDISLGSLHAHIEKHRGRGPFGIFQNPFSVGDFDALMERTEVLRADKVSKVTLDDVEVKS